MAGCNYYVYQYITEDGVPYYIGKGSKRRINEHRVHTQLPPIERRIMIKDGLTEKDAIALEMQLIRKYGRKKDGGLLDNTKLNQWACASGWHHKEETKKTISLKNTGKTRTTAQKKKYSDAKLKMTDTNKENIRNAVKNLWADPIYKQQRLEKTMETRRKNGFSK